MCILNYLYIAIAQGSTEPRWRHGATPGRSTRSPTRSDAAPPRPPGFSRPWRNGAP